MSWHESWGIITRIFMRVRELSGRLWTVFLYLLPQAGLHLQRDEENNEYQSEPESQNDLIAVVVLTVNRKTKQNAQ